MHLKLSNVGSKAFVLGSIFLLSERVWFCCNSSEHVMTLNLMPEIYSQLYTLDLGLSKSSNSLDNMSQILKIEQL